MIVVCIQHFLHALRGARGLRFVSGGIAGAKPPAKFLQSLRDRFGDQRVLRGLKFEKLILAAVEVVKLDNRSIGG